MDWLYWGTIIFLWFCIALNIWSLVRNIIVLKRFRKEHKEQLCRMEEWFDSYRKSLTDPKE